MSKLSETQHALLVAKLSKTIANQEVIIEGFTNAMKISPLNAFSYAGDKALVAAAVLEVFKGAIGVVESEGEKFDALLSAQRLSRMIMSENESPSHWSGLLSNQIGTAERQAKAKLVALLLEVAEQ
jgi:hypothetical protein